MQGWVAASGTTTRSCLAQFALGVMSIGWDGAMTIMATIGHSLGGIEGAHVVTLYRWQLPACVKFASGHGTTLWRAHMT